MQRKEEERLGHEGKDGLLKCELFTFVGRTTSWWGYNPRRFSSVISAPGRLSPTIVALPKVETNANAAKNSG